ncbi:murein L,D-transpeptidase catalytic domain family protein [Mucilaginibacter sp. AW1-3]
MGKRFLWVTCVSLVLSFVIISWTSARILKSSSDKAVKTYSGGSPVASAQLFSNYISSIYQSAKLADAGMDSTVFEKAVTGFFNLKMANKLASDCSVVTVVDLAKSSCSKRMWIVDLKKMQLVLNTWVSHGQGSGGDMATNFSNEVDSYQSSLGFYVTNNVYRGKHGASVRLNGMDEGFNDMASKRDIVVHAAPYVSQSSINQLGRLGRSQGCPAVSPKVITQVINTIKGKTMLFINGNDSNYTSKYLDRDEAANFAFNQGNGGSQATAML